MRNKLHFLDNQTSEDISNPGLQAGDSTTPGKGGVETDNNPSLQASGK